MDENEAIEEQATATPIFSVYRRGYDPEQVDRYVSEQQRRMDEALHRASESERKLAAAVGQLRELHRRVAVYESEARTQQPAQLDTLGERVQRILQEAWEGAYNLRQEAEREVNDMREHVSREVEELRAQAQRDAEEVRENASREAAEVVDEATRRALYIREETERRRQAYLERVELDRERAIAQITYLYDQRQGAIAELARLQATVEATIAEMVKSPLGRPAPGVAGASVRSLEPERPLVIHGIIDEADEAVADEVDGIDGVDQLVDEPGKGGELGIAGEPEPGEVDHSVLSPLPSAGYDEEATLAGAPLSELEAEGEQYGPRADFEGALDLGVPGSLDEGGESFEGARRNRLFEDLVDDGYESPADIPTGPMERIEAASFRDEMQTQRGGVFDAEQGGYT